MAEPYDRFEALIKLADFRRQIKESQRSIEWRVTLTVWALMVGLIAIVDKYPKWLVAIAALAIFAAHMYWVNWNFKRAEADSREMWAYHSAAIASLVGGEEPRAPSPPGSILRHPPVLAPIFVTGVLALSSIGISIMQKPNLNTRNAELGPAASSSVTTVPGIYRDRSGKKQD